MAYNLFGKEFEFIETGRWLHGSSESACAGFETNLPAESCVEYGPTVRYGQRTPATQRFDYLHLHYLKGLKPGRIYHYRLSARDERGNRIVSSDKTFRTALDANLRRIPEDFRGPPFVLDRPGTTYLVTKDLIIEGRAIEIRANDVTLDLGGHTVTYDNVRQGPPGELGDFPKFIDKSAFGVFVQGLNFKILNGTIRQGAGKDGSQVNAIGFNPIYLLSWGTGSEHGEIAGLTLDYSGDQMTGICTHEARTCEIHHNAIRDRGTVIMNRHQGCDAIGRAAEGKVHHNLVLRARHRGLGGLEVFDNEIYLDSFATNSFGICPVAGGKYYGNRIFGTGYHPVGIGWASEITVKENFIDIACDHPNARASEYGEQSSGNGMRLTQYAEMKVPYENMLYENNVIVVRGRSGCQMRGVQFFSDPFVKNLVFRKNIVKALAEDEETQQISCVTTQGNASRTKEMLPIRYEDNTFISNRLNVRFGDYYGVGSNHQFIRCKFVRVGDDPKYSTFFFDTGLPCKNHVLLDCLFEGGAGLDRVSWADKKADADFSVKWTLTLKSPSAAEVVIDDQSGAEVFHGKLEATRPLSVPLTEYVQKPGGKTYETPHQYQVSIGEKRVSGEVMMDQPQTVDVVP